MSVEAGKETYLGDGLYVSHDGYQICLRADSQRVYLEPQVWVCLLEWVKRLDSPGSPAGVEETSE